MSANSFKQVFNIPATDPLALVAINETDFALGGKPVKIEIFNLTQNKTFVWVRGMADDDSLEIGAAALLVAGGNGVTALVNTEIAPAGANDSSTDAQRLAGVTHIENGFRLGTAVYSPETAVGAADGDVLHIVAEVSPE